MQVYKNLPQRPQKLDLTKVDLSKLPKSALLGNYLPHYRYRETITRHGKNGKPFEVKAQRKFEEPNLPLSRMCAFRYAAQRAESFSLMKQVANQVPVNLGEEQGFELNDLFRFEVWLFAGESEDDRLLVWDSENMLNSINGSVVESSVLELLLIPGANPAKPDYNLA